MGRIVVMNNLTLDGVMQAPGRPEEDTRGGFSHGGWGRRAQTPDDAMGKAMGARMADGGGLEGWLFGRRTYEDLLSYWTQQTDSPFGPALTSTPKYVASTTLKEPTWPNTTLLRAEIPDAVAALKARSRGVLAIMGSGELIRTLLPHGLIDEFLLMIHPVLVGSGRRLFSDDTPFTLLRLVDSVTTSSGVVIATYHPEDQRNV
jgi:dihydrofolate reductase